MSIFDNLDLSGVGGSGGANPFAFMQTPTSFDVTPQAPPPQAPEAMAAPAVAGLAGTALGGAGDTMSGAAPDLGAKQSLLARIMAPSPDGLTFQDKLFAAGSILKGDSAGAQKHIESRRMEFAKTALEAQKEKAAADKLAQAQDQQKQQLAILAKNYDDKTGLDFGGLVRDAAAAHLPINAEDAKRYADMRTKYEAMNMGAKGGGFMADPYHLGPATQVVAPIQEAEPGFSITNGVESYIPGGSKDPKTIFAINKAEREAKPLEGRAPPKTPARGAFDPHEVVRKNPR